MSASKFRQFGLIAAGMAAGVFLSVGVTAWAQQQKPDPLPLDELRQLSNVFAIIKNDYVDPVSDKKLIDGAISGMVSSLDPHSAYLDEQAYKDMQQVTDGEFGGLGIEVGDDDGGSGAIKVIAPLEGTPAAKAGVLAGDRIIRINDTATDGLGLAGAVKLMRGDPGSPVTLTVMRGNNPRPIVLHMQRAIIKVQSVRGKMLADHVAYVRVSQFQERTGSDLAKELRTLGKSGAPRALVLDLRNNPGGLVTDAIGVAAAFLPHDSLVVSTDGRIAEARHKYLADASEYAPSGDDYLTGLPAWTKTVPMVVLVNIGSASAAEIVSGALQDHHRAQLLGNRTFGKGSVQVILPLSADTAVKITTSRYFTPDGHSIQAQGIEPNYVVDDTAQGNLFYMPREANLPGHLANPGDPDRKDEVKEGNNNPTPPANTHIFTFGDKDDFQLQQAINVLDGKPVLSGSPTGNKVAVKDAGDGDSAPAAAGASSGNVVHMTITPNGVVPGKSQ